MTWLGQAVLRRQKSAIAGRMEVIRKRIVVIATEGPKTEQGIYFNETCSGKGQIQATLDVRVSRVVTILIQDSSPEHVLARASKTGLQ